MKFWILKIFACTSIAFLLNSDFAYPKELKQKVYFDFGISFKVPDGWTVLPDDDLVKIEPPKDEKHIAVLHRQSQDLKELSLLIVSQVKKESNEETPLTRLLHEMLGISLLHPNLGFLSNFFEIVVSGQKGNRVDFELFSEKDQEEKVRSIVVVKKNKYFIVISFEQKKNTQKVQEQVFDEFLKGLNVNLS